MNQGNQQYTFNKLAFLQMKEVQFSNFVTVWINFLKCECFDSHPILSAKKIQPLSWAVLVRLFASSLTLLEGKLVK